MMIDKFEEKNITSNGPLEYVWNYLIARTYKHVIFIAYVI